MVEAHSKEREERSPFAGASLEISGEAGAQPLQIPVSVRSISGEVVILESESPLFQIDSEALDGRSASLRLKTAEDQETKDIRGTVVRTKFTSDEDRRLTLAMRPAQEDRMRMGVLENMIPSYTSDTQKFWERWDQARINHVTIFRRGKIHSALLGLALGVVTFKLTEPKSFNALGDLLLLVCGSVGAIEAIKFLRHKKGH
jgi:hypothetical protein